MVAVGAVMGSSVCVWRTSDRYWVAGTGGAIGKEGRMSPLITLCGNEFGGDGTIGGLPGTIGGLPGTGGGDGGGTPNATGAK